MVRSEERSVDERRYVFTLFTAGKSIRMLSKLAKIVGKPLALIVSSGMESQVTPEMIGSALQEMAAAASPEEFEQTCKEFLQGTKIFRDDGRATDLNFDIDFEGRIGHLSRVLKEMFSFQYSDFLGGRAAATPGFPATAQNRVAAI